MSTRHPSRPWDASPPERMQIFDTQVSATSHEALDWENLAYFGTTDALVHADARGPFDVSEDAIDALDGLATAGVRSARAWGVRAGAAIGVAPEATPARAHAALWAWLEERLQGDDVWAVGALQRNGLRRGDEIVERQLALAFDAELPVVVDVRGPNARRDVEWVLGAAAAARLESAAVVFTGVDYTCLRPIVDGGARGVLALGAGAASPEDAARMVARFGRPAFGRLMVSSAASGGATDVLAVPRFARALLADGAGNNDVDRVLRGNAVDVFRRGRRDQAS